MATLVTWMCTVCRKKHEMPPGEKCEYCPHCQANGSYLKKME
jgi:rubrerythrin